MKTPVAKDNVTFRMVLECMLVKRGYEMVVTWLNITRAEGEI